MNLGGTLLLIDPSDAMSSLGSRLRMQGFNVVEHRDPEEGVRFALLARPTLVVADLWMPKVSGVQLCRLLGAERTTSDVPVILRGPDGHRNRYWAERAGASAYVLPGRMGDLMRSIRSVLTSGQTPVQLWEDTSDAVGDVRDRIAQYLVALSDRRFLGLELSPKGEATLMAPGRSLPAGQIDLGDLDLLYLCARLTILERLAPVTKLPAIVEDPFPGWADAKLQLVSRMLKHISTLTQIVHVSAHPAHQSVADVTLNL